MPSQDSEQFQPRVFAVLVAHDGARWLPEVLTSLLSQTRPPDRIIAIDTGSTDRTLEILDVSGIETIHADRDCGFGEAINQARANLANGLADNFSTAQDWL